MSLDILFPWTFKKFLIGNIVGLLNLLIFNSKLLLRSYVVQFILYINDVY